jgi:hypothetical protein
MRPRLYYLLFFVILTVGAVDVALRQLDVVPPGRAYRAYWPPATPDEIIAGEHSPKLERALVRGSAFVHGLGAFYNEVVHEVLGRSSQRVVIRDDWIFVRDRALELPHADVETILIEVPNTISNYARLVRASGREPIIVIPPNRWRFFASLDNVFSVPPSHDRILEGTVAALRAEGITVVDILPALREAHRNGIDVFYRDDHHWTARGAEIAAHEVAAAVRMHVPAPADPARQFSVEWEGRPDVGNSLLQFMRFRRDSEAEAGFQHDAPYPEFTALADMRTSPRIAALTTSYGRWGFPEFLANALGEPVDAIVGAGKGSLFSVNGFLRRRMAANDASSIGAVVWEIPEYHLLRPELFAPVVPRYDLAMAATYPLSAGLTAESGSRIADSANGRAVETRRQTAVFGVDLSRPVSCVRLDFSIPAFAGRGYLRMLDGSPGDPFLVADGGVPASYVVRLDQPRQRFRMQFEARGAGVTLQLLSAFTTENGEC